jgi:lipopolysaccharide transport system ATP-binding protein
LLKILSRITEPTAGHAVVNGRVGSLLEVGTGFHLELTGRENIFLNGAILGMRKNEIKRSFDAIVAFAEVEKFIDTPVKHYSSGMYLRLAFAVAAHLETDILLVDEVLAVGDAAFQKKCLGKMGDVASAGKTVILVSHNMGSVAGLARRGMLLDQGRLVEFGDIHAVIGSYLSQVAQSGGLSGRVRDAEVYFESARLIDGQSIDSGETVAFEATIHSNRPTSEEFALHWFLKNEYGTPLVIGHDYVQHNRTHTLRPGANKFQFVIGPLPLTEGQYTISLEVAKPLLKAIDRIEDCLEFTVQSCRLESKAHSIRTSWGHGSIIVPFEIQLEPATETDAAQQPAPSPTPTYVAE